jgi:uncharacterized protein YacL
MAYLVDTNVLDNQLVMPRFVLGELQSIADSATSRIKALSGELALDLQKANITIKSRTSQSQEQSQSAPASSGSSGGTR